MNNMLQNGPIDKGEDKKNSTNVVPVSDAGGYKNPASFTGLTLDDFKRRFVFLTATGAIYDKFTETRYINFETFKRTFAGCEMEFNGKKVPVAVMWLKAQEGRDTKRNLTFAPGQGAIVRIGQHEFINTWRKIESPRRVNTDAGQPVVDLINALFADQADDFIDMLAYHWQHPGAQFSHAWLHVSDQTGTGRGRLTKALSAAWEGELAVIDDLGPFKSGNGVFSDRIIGKTFYVVEEMMDVSSDKYKAVANLNNAVTKDSLWINPKGEKGYEQLHRAIIFVQSNEIDCMPILAKDSRWKVAHYTGNQPFPDEWFEEFDGNCHPDNDMIIGFRQMLEERNVKHYKCGRVRKHSLAKLEVMDAIKTDLQRNLEAIVSGWKCPYLPTPWLKIILKDMGNGAVSDAAISKSMKELGCHAMIEATRITSKTRARCWVLPGNETRKGAKEELNTMMLDVFGTMPATITDDQVLQMFCHNS